jgi:transposase
VIAIPSSVRVWLAAGHTDMRRGMQGLALQVQEGLQRDPHAGDLFVFRGKRGDLVKILWPVDAARDLWPLVKEGAVSLTPAQLGYMLEGIDSRNPQHTWRPQAAG